MLPPDLGSLGARQLRDLDDDDHDDGHDDGHNGENGENGGGVSVSFAQKEGGKEERREERKKERKASVSGRLSPPGSPTARLKMDPSLRLSLQELQKALMDLGLYVEESCVTQHHITPFIHPLYTIIAVHTPMYTH